MIRYCKNDGYKLIYDSITNEWYCSKCGQVYEDDYEIRYTLNESNAMNLITQNDFREFDYLHQDFNKIVGNISEKNLSTSINLMIETRNKLLYFIYDNRLNSYKYEIMEYFNTYYKIFSINSKKYTNTIIIKILITYYSTHNLNLNLYDVVKNYIEDSMKDRHSKAKYKNILDFAKFLKENNYRIF